MVSGFFYSFRGCFRWPVFQYLIVSIDFLDDPALPSFRLPAAYRAYRRLPASDVRGSAMPQGRISKRSVDALVCPAGRDREFLWDDSLAGFGVGVFPTGRKV